MMQTYAETVCQLESLHADPSAKERQSASTSVQLKQQGFMCIWNRKV